MQANTGEPHVQRQPQPSGMRGLMICHSRAADATGGWSCLAVAPLDRASLCISHSKASSLAAGCLANSCSGVEDPGLSPPGV